MNRFLNSVILSVILLLGSCYSETRNATPDPNVVLLGIDAADQEIIELLLDRGELPGFARLKTEGAFGELHTIRPTESISIWTSIATGTAPTKHRIQTFTRRIPGTDQTVPSPGTSRRVPALWNIVSQAGKTVLCVKWFATWPAEEVNGIMLSPRLEPDSGGYQTYPASMFAEISLFRDKSTMDSIPKPPSKKQLPEIRTTPGEAQPAGMLIGQNQVKTKMFDDTSVWEAGKYLYEKNHPDLFMIYFKSIDRVEHFLWGAHHQLDTSPEKTAEAEAIFGWYRYFDQIIQYFMKERNTVLFVMSDHGMDARDDIPEPFDVRDIDFDLILQEIGVLKKNDANQTRWDQTTAYTVQELPYDWAILINMNLMNREPNGLIPPEQKTQTERQVAESLSALETTTGIPLFLPDRLSDPEADWTGILNPDVSLDDSVVFPSGTKSLRTFLKSKSLPQGIHTNAPPGILAAWGPGINPNHPIDSAHVFDITPTVLYSLGLPIAKDFDGKWLMDLFTPDHHRIHPPIWIDTYGKRDIDHPLQTNDSDEEIIKELKALGYI